MIRVLGFSLYGQLAASHRYRLGQYVSGLADLGIDLQIRSLLDDDYLSWKFFGKGMPPAGKLLRAGMRRFLDLQSAKEFDLAIVHCELFPLMPGSIERALIRLPYIYDFDDAMYLKYRSNRFGISERILRDKFDILLAGASSVTAGNHALRLYAETFNSHVHTLPTVVDIHRYIPARTAAHDIFTVGWIGSPSTASYLAMLVEPLSRLGLETPVKFVIVGGPAPAIPNVAVVEVPWSAATEVQLINSFDVGVMPLPDDAWSRGKCAFKLIQYMACSVPVIGSRVGANIDVVSPDCGYLVSCEQEWVDALRSLRDQPARRKIMGEAARKRVVQQYSLQCNLPILAEVIRTAAEKSK